MAEKVRYPQIPSTVWWGVRSIIQRTPNATIDERLLGVALGVQEAAARAYLVELRSVGLLSDENKATPLAQKWRLDDSYSEAVEQIIQSIYPEGLVHVAPPGDAERQKVVSWFLREGLGQGSAGNKAATYLMISSPTPNEAPRAVAKAAQGESAPRARTAPPKAQRKAAATEGDAGRAPSKGKQGDSGRDGGGFGGQRAGSETLPLNVNVQIHISADAGTEQIESIFQAMRRYLYDTPNS
ncbi:MAG TPA: hypothetical protein VGC51_11640 [Hansschlegelia sp.]